MPAPLLVAAAAAGLPLLADAISSALRRVDNPVAQTAATALQSVTEAVQQGTITPEQVSTINQHLEEMTRLDNEREIALQEQVNETMRAEAASEDRFTRRWRPFFGYVVSITWAIQMLAVAYVAIRYPTLAPALINSVGEGMALMWSVALSVLGIAVVKRSQDKARAVGIETINPIQRVVEAVTNRRSGS